MKTEMVEVREGENLGPIDWNYDFLKHGWDRGDCMNPKCLKESVERLKKLVDGKKYQATTDGGWPRCGWGDVIATGMYDGWPFWEPIPSVCISTPMGTGWHWFGSITDMREVK